MCKVWSWSSSPKLQKSSHRTREYEIKILPTLPYRQATLQRHFGHIQSSWRIYRILRFMLEGSWKNSSILEGSHTYCVQFPVEITSHGKRCVEKSVGKPQCGSSKNQMSRGHLGLSITKTLNSHETLPLDMLQERCQNLVQKLYVKCCR